MKCVIIKKVMTPAQIQSIYKVYSENAVTNIDITVDTSKEVRGNLKSNVWHQSSLS